MDVDFEALETWCNNMTKIKELERRKPQSEILKLLNRMAAQAKRERLSIMKMYDGGDTHPALLESAEHWRRTEDWVESWKEKEISKGKI